MRASLLLTLSLIGAATAATLEIADPFDVLEGDRVMRHLELLADDTLEGRGVGSRGGELAAAYLADRFSRLGLAPAGDGSYFQSFAVGGSLRLPTGVVVRAGDIEIEFQAGNEDGASQFMPLPGGTSGDVEGEVVFAGYGITAPEHAYDDYAGLDVTGKIVLVLRHEPGENDPDSVFEGRTHTRHAGFATKVTNAISHGAAGLLLVTDPLNHEATSPTQGMRRRMRPAQSEQPRRLTEDQQKLVDGLGLEDELASMGGAADLAGIPALMVEMQLADALLTRSGKTLVELQREIDESLEPRSRALDVSARVQTNLHIGTGRNVCAYLEGEDPDLTDEVVVVGAHYDHLGQGATGDIFNGADDNASGAAGLISLAEAFARSPVSPRRSLLFIAFDGEESGLEGSAHWVSAPTVPIENVVTMLNLDMIGRNPDQPVQIVGTPTGAGMTELVEGLAADLGIATTQVLDDTFMRSDQFSFYQQGIPVIFFSTGEHPQYHQTSDEAPLISPNRLRDVSRLAFITLASLTRRERPEFVNVDSELQRALTRARGPRLGVVPRPDEKGIFISRVVEDSPGGRAGLQVGDVVTHIGSDRIGGSGRGEIMRSLRAALVKVYESGKPATMHVIRAGESLELQLDMGGGQ